MLNKKITTPLTIVGVFAGIAEIAGTTVITFLSSELQSIFIWYVMLFPVLLVILFFATWNFNPTVLYSPSDYQNEDNFLTVLTKRYRKNIEELEYSLVDAKKEIIAKTTEVLENHTGVDLSSIEDMVSDKISVVMEKLSEAKNDASKIADFTTGNIGSGAQRTVMDLLSSGRSISLGELSRETNMQKAVLGKVLIGLQNKNMIISEGEGKMVKYRKNIAD